MVCNKSRCNAWVCVNSLIHVSENKMRVIRVLCFVSLQTSRRSKTIKFKFLIFF
ncbi:hypothetical protein HanIR_Chr16g0828281 [Helianthus annuus]|nr:hypothetical protein HanIR_Chr16g0828281 [Helianthus annuus]